MKNKIIFGMLFIFTLVIVLSCEKEDRLKHEKDEIEAIIPVPSIARFGPESD